MTNHVSTEELKEYIDKFLDEIKMTMHISGKDWYRLPELVSNRMSAAQSRQTQRIDELCA